VIGLVMAAVGPLYAAPVADGDIRDRDWFAARLADGATVTGIAAEAGVSRQTAHTWQSRHGLDSPNAKTRPTPARLQRLYDRYGSSARVATEIGVSTDTARRWLIAAGVELAPVGRPAAHLDVDALRSRRAAGATLNELAAEAGVSVETLRRHLAESASDD
jgi:hypothetical protein